MVYVECLPIKGEALHLNLTTRKRKRNNENFPNPGWFMDSFMKVKRLSNINSNKIISTQIIIGL
jgi:hypothetical protein